MNFLLQGLFLEGKGDGPIYFPKELKIHIAQDEGGKNKNLILTFFLFAFSSVLVLNVAIVHIFIVPKQTL